LGTHFFLVLKGGHFDLLLSRVIDDTTNHSNGNGQPKQSKYRWPRALSLAVADATFGLDPCDGIWGDTIAVAWSLGGNVSAGRVWNRRGMLVDRFVPGNRCVSLYLSPSRLRNIKTPLTT
jgi:hypothetical protein